jgi:hypothetical protein
MPAGLNQPPDASQADPAGLGLNDKRQPKLSAAANPPNHRRRRRILLGDPLGC